MKTFLTAVVVSAALLTSVSAQDRRNNERQTRQSTSQSDAERTRSPQGENNNRAYYDSKHRDWHQWNDKEEQSYRRYANEHHQDNKDFAQTNEREQQQYWNWRHKHPDEH